MMLMANIYTIVSSTPNEIVTKHIEKKASCMREDRLTLNMVLF